MKRFENEEEIVHYIFQKIADGEELVSVVANKNMVLYILSEFMCYTNINASYIDVDDCEYDKEYMISIYNDEDSDVYDLSIEPTYDHENKRYVGTDGYILFHGDVSSKALLDIRDDESLELTGYDWFLFYEEEDDDDPYTFVDGQCYHYPRCECSSDVEYTVNGKQVSKDEYEEVVKNIKDKYESGVKDMLLKYNEFLDEICEWEKLLRL